jgi:hypothetical protein
MKDKILKKLDDFIIEANGFLADVSRKNDNDSQSAKAIKQSKFDSFKTGVLSFLKSILGTDEIYYNKFLHGVLFYTDYSLVLAIDLLQRAKKDINEDWLQNIKGIVSAELFTDFLDMAEHLLDETYKDAAAVIIGGVLEENLRQLSLKNGLPIAQTDSKTGKMKPLKAENLNTELSKNHVYNLLYQKSVTAWLDLRNKAAHSQYTDYDINLVKSFLQFARDFAAKFV